MIERDSSGPPIPPEPPVRRPRALLILLVIALPIVMGAVFFFRWDVLDPRYWSLDGIAVLAKFSEIDLDLPPEYVSDWGAADLNPPRPEQLELARLLRAGDDEALAAVSREVVLGFNDTSPELEGPLDAWVAAMPGSAAARMARGVYWRQIGWHRRGGRSGNRTARAQFAGMRDAFDQAEADFLAVIDLDPAYGPAYAELAGLYRHSSRDRAALASLVARAADAGAEATALYRQLFRALSPWWSGLSTAQSIAAMKTVLAALEADPRPGVDLVKLSAYPDFIAAQAEIRSGDKEKGLALYRTFVDGPGGGFFLDDFAKVLKRTGRRSEALAYHVRAANQDPNLLADDENYPELLIRLRHYDEALRVLEMGLMLDPYSPDLLQARGDVRVMRRQFNAAADDYERAMVHGGARASLELRLHWLAGRRG